MSSFFPISTVTVSPSLILPSIMSRARGFSSSFWIRRLSGRAPKAGSWPWSARWERALSVSSRVMP